MQTLSREHNLRARPTPCLRCLHPAHRAPSCERTSYLLGKDDPPPAPATYSGRRGSDSIQRHTSHSCLLGNSACKCSGLSPAHSHPRVRGYSCKLRETCGGYSCKLWETPAFRGSAGQCAQEGGSVPSTSPAVFTTSLSPPVILERAQPVLHFLPA